MECNSELKRMHDFFRKHEWVKDDRNRMMICKTCGAVSPIISSEYTTMSIDELDVPKKSSSYISNVLDKQKAEEDTEDLMADWEKENEEKETI